MAQTVTAKTKLKNGNDNFPILFEGRIRVYKNPTDEIFVEDIQSGVTMRIDYFGRSEGGLQFTTGGRVEPTQVHGMIGWRVGPR